MNTASLPAHKAALFLTHNEHLNNYETAAEQISVWDDGQSPHWKNAEAKDRAIATNQIWQLQWYPETPVGFVWVAAPTLNEVLEVANFLATTPNPIYTSTSMISKDELRKLIETPEQRKALADLGWNVDEIARLCS